MRPVLQILLLGLLAATTACKEDAAAILVGGSGPPADAGMPTTDIQFTGITNADALGPTEAIISWSDAVLLPNLTGAAGMFYRIYRGDSVQEAKDAQTPVHTTQPGVTAWVDSTLEPFKTYFYRVVAVDTNDRTSISDKVTSARTPSDYVGGVIDYDLDILPLWSSASPTNPGTNCLSCHTMPGPGRLDLSTREGATIGVGTAQQPNSFLVSFDPDATWAEFLGRMSAGLVMLNHLPWFSNPSAGLSAMEQPLREWANEGATAESDVFPPVFAIGGVGNVGNYFGTFIDFDSIEITFPHADDPETLPPNGNRAGQIEYAIYGGLTTNEIDWDTPIALATVTLATANDPVVTAEFDWPFGGLAIIVVRPIDSAGRTVAYDPLLFDPETATPAEIELMKLRMRNQTPNEREIVVVR